MPDDLAHYRFAILVAVIAVLLARICLSYSSLSYMFRSERELNNDLYEQNIMLREALRATRKADA